MWLKDSLAGLGLLVFVASSCVVTSSLHMVVSGF